MTRRTALKTVAFAVGLYFVLEFLLPEKIGGDFDSFEIAAPAPVLHDGSLLVFYAGEYRKGLGGIGRLVRDSSSSSGWVRLPHKPVVERSLFVPYDRKGLDALDAVSVRDSIVLTYIGYNNESEPTLCSAVSRNNGLSFRKTGPVVFSTNGFPHPSIRDRNGVLPGRLLLYAVSWSNDVFLFDLVLNVPGTGLVLWQASGATLTNQLLAPAPACNISSLCGVINTFDSTSINADTTWLFGIKNKLISFRPAFPDSQMNLQLSTNAGSIASFRAGPGGTSLFFNTVLQAEKTRPESSPRASFLCSAYLPARTNQPLALVPFKSVGAFGTPTYLSRATNWFGQGMQIVGAFGMFIALINLMMFHGKKVLRREKGSYNSLIFIGALLYMTVFAAVTQMKAPPLFFKLGVDFGFNSLMVPMGAAVFSMITFYLISAAYRSFRIRSLEAGLLMVAAVIVMVGQMPIGEWLASFMPRQLVFLHLPWLSQKILTVINAAAYRGVWIGMLVGMFAISLRIWLGIDNSVYAGVEKND